MSKLPCWHLHAHSWLRDLHRLPNSKFDAGVHSAGVVAALSLGLASGLQGKYSQYEATKECTACPNSAPITASTGADTIDLCIAAEL